MEPDKKKMEMPKRYLLYLLRWQCSTPILALCFWKLQGLGLIESTIIGNLIGGLIFFWIDRQIFRHKKQKEGDK
jgi:membrane protein YqaA with SNARE-associated domain